jgi:menaquinone-dependent protoporphyrinogen IX oxidase
MNGTIIYAGKYGATEQYAKWLSEEIKMPMLALENVNSQEIILSDFLVIGSSVYMGKLLVRDWLKQNRNILRNKTLFLFVVCGNQDEKERALIIENNVQSSFLNITNTFFLRGRVIRERLSWKDKLFLKLGSMLEKDPVKRKEMLQDFDAVKKENLAGLVKAIEGFSSERLKTQSGEKARQQS